MSNLNSPARTICQRAFQRNAGVAASMLLVSAALLTGCAGTSNDAPTESATGVTLQGYVHGGQNPVSGATIQLYAAQAGGYAGASVSLLTSGVTTGGNGGFTITGDYTPCPSSPNDQVYIVATGGSSGSGTNPNLALMAALGPCSALTSSTVITLNEVTTVASVYALAGFMTDYKHVGTSSTNYIGLSNAMATVNNLVNVAAGTALAVTPAYATQATGTTSATFASVVPQEEINTLADSIASCVNTNGVGGSSTTCANLFASSATNTATGGVSGTPDTIQAVLNIAKNPGTNVAAIYNFSTGNPPFPTTLGSAPNDWTMALNFKGGGMGGSAASSFSVSENLAIDKSGNLWITNTHLSTLTELSNLGAPISNNTQLTPSVVVGGFSGGGLSSDSGIAVDLASPAHVWVGNNNGTLSEFTSAGSPVGSGFTGGGLAGSGLGVAVDGNDNVWIASNGVSATLAEFNNSGAPVSSSGYASDISIPTGAIAVDGSENVFVANGGNGFLDKINQGGGLAGDSGNVLSNSTGYGALDASGLFWVPQVNQVLTFGNNAAPTNNNFSATSISNPEWIGVDGANHTWIVNQGGELGQAANANLTELTNGGTPISPGSTGYIGAGTAGFVTPKGGGIDASGNVWIVNGGNSSSVTEFVGAAAPTYMPLAAAVAANKIGQMP
jgi:hypothetical protein